MSAGQAQAALRSLATEPELQRFYDRAQWRLVWTDATARALEDAIAHRANHGLDRLFFPSSVEPAASPEALDVARTRAALRYARALAMGVVDPATLHAVYTLPRPDADIVVGLATALDRGDLPAWLAGLAPQHADYRRLSEAYRAAVAEQRLGNGSAPPIAANGLIRPADRARTLAVALERLRWLARNPPATRIDVNIAAARLTYYRDGVPVDSRKVIVGKPGRETPLLSSPIYRLVANPTWTIPKSIENTELAHVGPDYLASHNMVRRGGYIVQQPGPDNALGMVKFDMINDQAIYLHDTSAPGLFERSQRHLSHGCVRVDDALGFAQLLAEDEGVADRWQAASASGEQIFVALPVRIPVRLLYQNAFVDEIGRVTVRTDPYDWNGSVARALGFDDGSRTRTQADAIDIGP
ncbi:L,D-transpeptidase family protein [Sphingomonas elodea]|uniref:L,D-transpeptidase family protein n=1 Tax=Sphingomonas elodea TaxID=179878 RepID=UPI00026301B4|nr:L,D-transpeptidase family protein [Sphingomonas elodea]